TLDRLFKKGLLTREKDGRAYVYSPRLTREEFERGVAEDVLGDLLGRSRGAEPLLACIVDAVSEHDRALLDELQRLVEEKRRELSEGEEQAVYALLCICLTLSALLALNALASALAGVVWRALAAHVRGCD